MKLAIDILMAEREVLRKGVRTQTSNAEDYSRQAKKNRSHAAYYEVEAVNCDRSAERACLERSQFQVRLNEIDAAIAKLES